MLHLLGFDHEVSEEAEVEMEKEEELLLKSLGWKGKGLIQSAHDAETHVNSHEEKPDGSFIIFRLQFHILLSLDLIHSVAMIFLYKFVVR